MVQKLAYREHMRRILLDNGIYPDCPCWIEEQNPNLDRQEAFKAHLKEWNVVLDHFVDSFSKCEVSLKSFISMHAWTGSMLRLDQSHPNWLFKQLIQIEY